MSKPVEPVDFVFDDDVIGLNAQLNIQLHRKGWGPAYSATAVSVQQIPSTPAGARENGY